MSRFLETYFAGTATNRIARTEQSVISRRSRSRTPVEHPARHCEGAEKLETPVVQPSLSEQVSDKLCSILEGILGSRRLNTNPLCTFPQYDPA